MFILWSEQEYEDKYILFAKNNIDELKQDFLKFYEQVKDEYELNNIELTEKEFEIFSLNSDNNNFYISNIHNVDANELIYLLRCSEDGEGGSYVDDVMFKMSNSKDDILQSATDYFICESKKTEQKHIDKMLNALNTKGYYAIPHCIANVCDMELSIFKPYEI